MGPNEAFAATSWWDVLGAPEGEAQRCLTLVDWGLSSVWVCSVSQPKKMFPEGVPKSASVPPDYFSPTSGTLPTWLITQIVLRRDAILCVSFG